MGRAAWLENKLPLGNGASTGPADIIFDFSYDFLGTQPIDWKYSRTCSRY